MISVNEVTVCQLKEWLNQGLVTLVDVREPFEYDSLHIPGALCVPLSLILKDLFSLTSKIVFYCQSGKRSAVACHYVLSQNPEAVVYTLTGGIQAWQNAGCDVVMGKKS